MPSNQAETSIYEDLYRELIQDHDQKRGTYYERLVAVVQKLLHQSDVVIHDIRLVGDDTGEKHQVDVIIEKNSVRKHCLFECKDFSERNAYNKVGIGIVRGFFGLCDDVKPDLAAIVSCTGFSKPAIGYALNKPFDRDKHIQLITIREFQEKDWENRIRAVILRLHIKQQKIPRIDIQVDKNRLTPEIKAVLPELMKETGVVPSKQVVESSQFNKPTTLQDLLTEEIKKVPFGDLKAEGETTLPDDCVLTFRSQKLPVVGYKWSFEFDTTSQDIVAGADKIARLLVEFVTQDKTNGVIWEDELTKWKIEPKTKEVVRK